VYVLFHFDWFGSIEELEKLEAGAKKHWDGSDGVKFLGRFGPHNKKYHWTHFYKVTDMSTWANRKPFPGYKRDYKIVTHQEFEYYSDV